MRLMLKIYKRTQAKSLKVSSYFLIQGHNLNIGAKLYTHKSAIKFKKGHHRMRIHQEDMKTIPNYMDIILDFPET